MNTNNLVRPSRDGDQFHYLWAARHCLMLLDDTTDLKAITVEDISPFEGSATSGYNEIVDVAKYYGSENAVYAKKIIYYQLKHSTVQTEKDWTPSELKNTLEKFSAKYLELIKEFGQEKVDSTWQFCFVSNRKISNRIAEAVACLTEEKSNPNENIKKRIQSYTVLNDVQFNSFCRILTLNDHEEGFLEQNKLLSQELSGYLPGQDIDAPTLIKELIARKATSEFSTNPTITKYDILKTIGVDPTDLFPAKCLIDKPKYIIKREFEDYVMQEIIKTTQHPILLHADGGIGKTVFVSQIHKLLPEGSETILYDCFGNGSYLSPSKHRHRHIEALVQISNELASKGLCHPLIPYRNADEKAYLKAFHLRLKQASSILDNRNSHALLCIVIDAADNAEMASVEYKHSRSFAKDLISEEFEHNIRVLFTVRTHRVDLLEVPSRVKQIQLKDFSTQETEILLKKHYPEATKNDVEEFHTLSSANPRVQSTALAEKESLHEILTFLGPKPTSLDTLFDKSFNEFTDSIVKKEKDDIHNLCKLIAILKPPISLSTLSKASGLDGSFIRSFISDIKRPLFINESILQYRDEPSETWFRERFKPLNQEFDSYVKIIRSFAEEDVYLASILPYLLLEAGKFDELIELAKSNEWLPKNNEIDARKIKLERIEFALKACLRKKNYLDAAKLGLAGGREAAGSSREKDLLRSNSDLVSKFTDTFKLEDISHHSIEDTEWFGSKNVYKACLLSGKPELKGEARSRLRIGIDWLSNWSENKNRNERVSDEDRAEFTLAHMNIIDAKAGARFLRRWRTRDISFTSGRLLTKRLIEHGRFEDIDSLAHAAGYDFYLILAINLELRKINKIPPMESVNKAFKILSRDKIKFEMRDTFNIRTDYELTAIAAFVETLQLLGNFEKQKVLAIIEKHKKTNYPEINISHFSQKYFQDLNAYILFHFIEEKEINLVDFAGKHIKEIILNQRSYNNETLEFNKKIGALLPWLKSYYEFLLRKTDISNYTKVISDNLKESELTLSDPYRYNKNMPYNHIALTWAKMLIASKITEKQNIDKLQEWVENKSEHFSIDDYCKLAFMTIQYEPLRILSFNLIHKAYNITKKSKENSEEKIRVYVKLSRICLHVSENESREYFNEAIKIASRMGEETTNHWHTLIDIAKSCSKFENPKPKVAYNLARYAEVISRSINSKYLSWRGLIETMVEICPASTISILSRWRDRNFGDYKKLLPIAIEYLINQNKISGLLGLILFKVQAEWDIPFLLEEAFKSVPAEKREILFQHFYKYFRFNDISSQNWKDISEITKRHNILINEIDELISYKLKEENIQNIHYPNNIKHENAVDWETLFSNMDPLNPNDIISVFVKFKDLKISYYSERFFNKLCQQIPTGKEVEFLRIFSELDMFNFHDFEDLIDVLPKSWWNLLSVKRELLSLIRTYCSKSFNSFISNHQYESRSFCKIIKHTEYTKKELIEITLEYAGKTPESFNSENYFELVCKISTILDSSEALDVLNFAFGQFREEVEDDDADGIWNEELQPPDTVDNAIAGYIYALLASPHTNQRWEAAHVICTLAEFEQVEIIKTVVNFVEKNSTGVPFVDRRLCFYHLHTLQWLMIAFARISHKKPTILSKFFDFIYKYATNDYKHVIIRHFASNTLKNIIASGCANERKHLLMHLEKTNKTPFPMKKSDGYPKVNKWGMVSKTPDKYSLEYDISRYWLDILCECFEVPHQDIETTVGSRIVDEWGINNFKYWKDDLRRSTRHFENNEYRHSHGSYPMADGMDFYYIYHSIMFTVGELLEQHPVHVCKHFRGNLFKDFLERHLLTRNDFLWLSDRCDPKPLEWPEWKKQSIQHEQWKYSLSKNDFKRVLENDDDYIVWGSWTYEKHGCKENIEINSALVKPAQSHALMRALQTCYSVYDFHLPGYCDDDEIDNFGYSLKGWVQYHQKESKIDKFDSWGGSTMFPPLRPMKDIIKMFELESDHENSFWLLKEGATVFKSESWIDNKDSFRRLKIKKAFLPMMLKKLNHDLIVSIEIERDNNNRKDSFKGEEIRQSTSFLIVVFTTTGETYGL